MTIRHLRFLLLVAFLALTACAGIGEVDPAGENPLTPTPPVPVFGDFILGVATSNPPAGASLNLAKSLSFENGGIFVDETRNTISDISFEAEGEAEIEVEFPGTYIVELVRDGEISNQEFPGFGVTRIPFGEYSSFRMKFKNLDSDEIPSELLPDPLVSSLLVDNAFVVTGAFMEREGKDVNNDGRIDLVPFQIISDNSVEIKTASPNLFSVTEENVNFFFIAFQIQIWFQGLLPQFQDLDPQDLVGGVAVVQDGSGSSKIDRILEDFETNTESSCKSAPSEDGEFEEDDVDDESESGPL